MTECEDCGLIYDTHEWACCPECGAVHDPWDGWWDFADRDQEDADERRAEP